MEPKGIKYKFKGKVWVYPGLAGWRFLNLPKKQSAQIKKLFTGLERGWGSLPVLVTIGNTTWKTSIFPDKKTQSYLLPLKSLVRKKENIKDNGIVVFILEIKI